MTLKPQHMPHWATSAGGLPIELYSFVANVNHNPLLFIGGVHGDEPEGVQLAETLRNWLLNETLLHPEKMVNWYLIPCLNPDGFTATPRERTNANGVDLNRNFPSRDWTNVHKAPRYNPGFFSGSEPEVQALVALIKSSRPSCIFHFHSWTEPCVVYTGEAGHDMASLISASSGYPARPEIGYATPGSLGQYGWLDLQTPVICIEELEGRDLNEIWSRFETGFRHVIYEAWRKSAGV